MDTQIIEMVGMIAIVGVGFIAIKVEVCKNKALKKEKVRINNLFDNSVRHRTKLAEDKIELKEEIEELHKNMESDNEIMSKRMAQIGDLQEEVRKGADRLAKDQIKIDVLCKQIEGKDSDISDLNHELCEANYKVVELESELEDMKKIGFRKIERARKLGGVRK